MRIVRRLFVVPIANNDHGKTTMLRALVSQGLGQTIHKHQKNVRELTSPYGRLIDAYVFARSYQEVEKTDKESVQHALDRNDPDWRKRELIIMPSHISDIHNNAKPDDIDQMITLAHSAGFDIICVAVIFTGTDTEKDEREQFASIWKKPWDERWTLPNPYTDNPNGQLEALGRDLWTWICKALMP